RFYFRGDAPGHLDRDHVRAGGLDRVLQLDLAAVQLQSARLAYRVNDVLRGDRAEQATVVARLLWDREDGLLQQRRVLVGPLRRLARGALSGLDAPLSLGDRARRGRLGQLARHQVVAQVAGSDVHDVATLAERVHTLQQDRLSHRLRNDAENRAWQGRGRSQAKVCRGHRSET